MGPSGDTTASLRSAAEPLLDGRVLFLTDVGEEVRRRGHAGRAIELQRDKCPALGEQRYGYPFVAVRCVARDERPAGATSLTGSVCGSLSGPCPVFAALSALVAAAGSASTWMVS